MVSLVVQSHGIGEAVNRLTRLANWRPNDAARKIAPILESQTRRRIEAEKTSPEGRAWAPNRTRTSILLRTGRHLRDSISHRASGGDAIVEATWKYAHVHQKGATIRPKSARRLVFMLGDRKVFASQVKIPARPFMGLSAANEKEIIAELNAMLMELGGGRR